MRGRVNSCREGGWVRVTLTLHSGARKYHQLACCSCRCPSITSSAAFSPTRKVRMPQPASWAHRPQRFPCPCPPGVAVQRADALLERQQRLVDLRALQPRLLVVVVRVCVVGWALWLCEYILMLESTMSPNMGTCKIQLCSMKRWDMQLIFHKLACPLA